MKNKCLVERGITLIQILRLSGSITDFYCLILRLCLQKLKKLKTKLSSNTNVDNFPNKNRKMLNSARGH
jgi:hypothetical protein